MIFIAFCKIRTLSNLPPRLHYNISQPGSKLYTCSFHYCPYSITEPTTLTLYSAGLLQLSAATALGMIVSALPKFLSSYINDIVTKVSCAWP